jgi:hypothetical protein
MPSAEAAIRPAPASQERLRHAIRLTYRMLSFCPNTADEYQQCCWRSLLRGLRSGISSSRHANVRPGITVRPAKSMTWVLGPGWESQLSPSPRRNAPEPRQRGAMSRHRLLATYSMSLSARSTKPAGNSRPIAPAAFMFITRSNRVGCSTGISAGLVPRRTETTCRAIMSR